MAHDEGESGNLGARLPRPRSLPRMPSLDEVAFVKAMPLFCDLSEEQVARLLALVTRGSFRPGQTIIREGEVGESLYILLEGQVEVSKTLTMKVGRQAFEKLEKSFVRLDARDHACFGEMGVLQQDERSATVVALTECRAFEITRERFDQFCEADPRAGYLVARRLLEVLAARLRTANQDVLKLTTALSLALAR